MMVVVEYGTTTGLQRWIKRLSYFRFPVVAMGILKWVDYTLSEPSFFKLMTDSTPLHLALLDEVRFVLSQFACWIYYE